MRVLALLLALSLGAWAQVVPGQAAPGFALPDWHGNRCALEQFRGKPTLLNFWACWCDTWKFELEQLRALRRGEPELEFAPVFVAVDSRERTLAEPELAQAGLAWPVLLDSRSEVSQRYGISTVPTLFVLDAEGVVRYVHQGYPGNRLLALELRSCREPSAPAPDLARPDLAREFLIPAERTLLSLVQEERSRRFLSPLQLSPEMTEVGREYLQRMLVEDFFSHRGPEPPDVRLRRRGLHLERVGENLARAGSPQEALRAMLASPEHKSNLLSRQFEKVGVAALRVGPDGFLFCLLFAR